MTPRPGWPSIVRAQGLTFHSSGLNPKSGVVDGAYWREDVAYEFTEGEVDAIEAATNEIDRLCRLAVRYALDRPAWLERFGLDEAWADWARVSFERGDPWVGGRFDLAYAPDTGVIKLLEYNADTPTTLIETAVVQWFWMKDCVAGGDQFNSLHERLIARWAEIAAMLPAGAVMHFTGLPDYPEEYQTTAYMMDVATQAGITCRFIAIGAIGWDGRNFLDEGGRRIGFLWKLYPWEWIRGEPFGQHFLGDRVGVVEPPWKLLLSNKMVLPLLWEMAPGHPNLAPAFAAQHQDLGQDFIVKPALGREGANMTLVRRGAVVNRTDGSYGDQPMVYQQACEMPSFDGHFATIGSWCIGGIACGMAVREDTSAIITNASALVPHYFRPANGGAGSPAPGADSEVSR